MTYNSMSLYNPHLDTEAEPYVTKEYGPNNEDLDVSKLKEVFVVVYTVMKKGAKEPEEIYSFTTDFEQAFKRFKLLPNNKCFLKRFLTDDEKLIQLAIDGTKPKVEMDDNFDCVEIKELLDKFRDEDDDGRPIYETGLKTSNHSPSEFEETKHIHDVNPDIGEIIPSTPRPTPNSPELCPPRATCSPCEVHNESTSPCIPCVNISNVSEEPSEN